jgi:dTDP-L-rhamnose 4-epimerase
VNIEDVVRANLLVLEKEEANYQCFNVGGGRAYTVLEFAEIVARVFGRPFEPQLTGEFRFGDTRHIMSDITKLKSLGWEPRNDAEYSVQTYKEWLMSQDASEELLEYAYRHMRELNVIAQSRQRKGMV